MVKVGGGGFQDDFSSQGSYMLKVDGGVQDDLSSQGSNMVKVNNN